MHEFATRLNRLFDMAQPVGRKPITNSEVVKALAASGHHISNPYLSQLRSGQRTNPSEATITALARFFKVRPDYFFDDEYADTTEHDLRLVNQLKNRALRQLAVLAFDLSEESRHMLGALAEKLRQTEGLIPDRFATPRSATRHQGAFRDPRSRDAVR
ncbi:helix-turn-helix domain-containing protein [Skermania sp. ID1734]|uniref:helix-turn-helix domain-containing protein n=1 Tax=Skermania sp. ID1734 TaxID=2597516 RepID=UPI00117FBB7F|nr:helix-turn-helix domain-containing protein [Skermania sp. ID1734]TSE00398.1 helix-turn-helix domain-containing protein [Skermania sp. ID1734]